MTLADALELVSAAPAVAFSVLVWWELRTARVEQGKVFGDIAGKLAVLIDRAGRRA